MFILCKILKFLYAKFLEGVANITAKFKLHTRINFLFSFSVQLFIFYKFLYIQFRDIELNPGPKSSLSPYL